MPPPLITLTTAAASFACQAPATSHHDGDNLRCANVPGTMRLQGIDGPEMPGACQPGRNFVDGDPFAARDHLRSLTRGKTLQCVQEDTRTYGRAIVNCTAGAVNISCAMIESGHAVACYAPIDCGPSAVPEAAFNVTADPSTEPAPQSAPQSAPEPPLVIVPAETPSRAGPFRIGFGLAPIVLFALLLINLITWALLVLDKRRAVAGHSGERIAEPTTPGLSLMGGSSAAWHAIKQLRHKSAKDSFKQPLLLISGLQIGALIGLLWGQFWI